MAIGTILFIHRSRYLYFSECPKERASPPIGDEKSVVIELSPLVSW